MSIDTILLMLESALLVVTIIVLLLSIRESSHRRNLLMAISKATRTLTRIEYFTTVVDSINEAKHEIIGYVTGRRAGGDDERRIAAILDAISRAVKRGVRVRYLLPKFHGRIYMGYLYSSAGAEIKYSAGLTVQSLRYMVVDGEKVVIGIPETQGQEEITGKGNLLPSRALAEILKNHFESRWEKGLSFTEFVHQVAEQTGAPLEQLPAELGIDKEWFRSNFGSLGKGERPKKEAGYDS